MGKFKLEKKIDLSDYAEGAYLSFVAPAYKDIETFVDVEDKPADEATKAVISTLSKLFANGKLPTKDGLTDVTKDDIADIPVEILTKSVQELVGQDPNE